MSEKESDRWFATALKYAEQARACRNPERSDTLTRISEAALTSAAAYEKDEYEKDQLQRLRRRY